MKPPMSENDDNRDVLGRLREGIDEIDNQILDLINRRLSLAMEIGRIKAGRGERILDMARESIVLNRLSGLNSGPISQTMLHQVFRQIIAAAREIQKSHRISYLGPEATFTHIAAMSHFGQFLSYIPQSTIEDVFTEVEKGRSHYGVIPMENSTEGALNHAFDYFFESDLNICAERYLVISHDLLSRSGTLKDIRTVYAHPQAFARCRGWLRKYLPDAIVRECSDTATAAKNAAMVDKSAAIGNKETAGLNQLEVIASRIEDVQGAMTRFLIIGHDDVHCTGNDKTSILFVTSHVPGALFKVLEPVAAAGVNMLSLESRPTKHQRWSYFFFADFEGHRESDQIRNVISQMQQMCLYLKCLGSYAKDQ